MSRTARLGGAALGLGLCLLFLSLAPPVAAEKPMSSPAQLAGTATHIVRGEVVRVYRNVWRSPNWEKVRYVAEVKVAAVEKGEGIRLDRPLYARYWTQGWRGRGDPPPGTNGHAPIPNAGDAVRVHLARNAYDGFGTEVHDGGYDVLGVNGWQILTPEEVRKAEAEAAPQTVLPFPQAWFGVWQGDLTVTKPDGATEETTFLLVIRPLEDPNRFEFRMRYGRETPQRAYELVAQDAAKGRWAIDEKNGIVLPATFLDGELFSYFSLGGNLLLARYRLEGDFLRFDLTQTTLAPETTTGGGAVPAVGGHVIRVLQRATLRR